MPAAAAAAATEIGYDSDSHCAAVFRIMWPCVNIRDGDFMTPRDPALHCYGGNLCWDVVNSCYRRRGHQCTSAVRPPARVGILSTAAVFGGRINRRVNEVAQ